MGFLLSCANTDPLGLAALLWEGFSPSELSGKKYGDGLLMSAKRVGWRAVVHRLQILYGQFLEYAISVGCGATLGG